LPIQSSAARRRTDPNRHRVDVGGIAFVAKRSLVPAMGRGNSFVSRAYITMRQLEQANPHLEQNLASRVRIRYLVVLTRTGCVTAPHVPG
jgi:hypothetical protein